MVRGGAGADEFGEEEEHYQAGDWEERHRGELGAEPESAAW